MTRSKKIIDKLLTIAGQARQAGLYKEAHRLELLVRAENNSGAEWLKHLTKVMFLIKQVKRPTNAIDIQLVDKTIKLMVNAFVVGIYALFKKARTGVFTNSDISDYNKLVLDLRRKLTYYGFLDQANGGVINQLLIYPR